MFVLGRSFLHNLFKISIKIRKIIESALITDLGNAEVCFDEYFICPTNTQWKGARPFVSTKVGRLKSDNAHETIVDYSAERMKCSLHESLQTLGIDFIDLLFLHEPYLAPLDRINEVLDTLK